MSSDQVWEDWGHICPDRDCLAPAYLQLAAMIRGVIVGRQVPCGTPLPGESDAAERWSVSRETVRKAYGILRQYGVIRSEHGIGSFVGAVETKQTLCLPYGTVIEARRPMSLPAGLATLSPIARALGVPIYLIRVPGEPERYYDVARTTLCCCDPEGC